MSGHTPGPWRMDEPYFIYVWGPDQQMVADLPDDEDTYLARMRGVGRGATPDEQRANARLIAAAPDLLHRLLAHVEGCACSPSPYDSPCANCRADIAAIAKAESK